MQYQIVSGMTMTELILQVGNWIKNGWEPQGGASGNYNAGFFQALIKRTDDECS